MRIRLFLAVCFGLLVAMPNILAVEPDEVLPDATLEERARALSKTLRCMVCQNQSIDDSNAPLARDLRLLVRERLRAGDSDQQVRDFLVARYGEFVLLEPRFSGRTLLLWGAPLLVLVFGVGAIFLALRRRPSSPPEPLTSDEKQRLSRITDSSSDLTKP